MKSAALLCCLICASAANAQDVWRCGTDGSRYGPEPCAEGRPVQTADTRTAADVQVARALAARERELADRLVRERLERERQEARAGNAPAGFRTGPRAEPRAEKRVSGKKPPQPFEARGTSPSTARGSRQTTG